MNFRRFVGFVAPVVVGLSSWSAPVGAQEDDPRLQKLSPDLLNRLMGAASVEDFTVGTTGAFRGAAGRDGILTQDDILDTHAIENARVRADLVSKLLANDLDGNGSVSPDEIARTMADRDRPGTSDSVALSARTDKAIRKIMRADTDGDKILSFPEMLVEAGKDADTRTDGREAGRADALMAFDVNADGGVTLQEVRAEAPKIFALVDLDGDELLSAVERAAFQPQAKRIIMQQRDDAMMVGCDFPRPTPDQQIVVLQSDRGLEIPRVSVAGTGETTWSAALTIEAGTTPLWILVNANDPMLWRIDGATDRVAKLVVVPDQRNELPAAGVVGLTPDKIRFIDPARCQLRKVLAQNQKRLPEMLTRLLGRTPEKVISTDAFFAATLPSGIISTQPPATGETPAVIPMDVWQEARRFGSTRIFEVDPTLVTATVKAEAYDVLPEESGIVQLVSEGAIVPKPAKSFVSADFIPIDMQTRYRGYLYEIVKPIPYFPAGLSGAHAVTFVLAKGVPMPRGDPGHSCVLDGTTGKPLNESPICRRE